MAKYIVKKYVYTKLFKNYEVELTWELFLNLLGNNGEFFFNYKSNTSNSYYTLDICFTYLGDNKIYIVNIGNEHYENINHFEFNTINELLDSKIIENKSIRELWPSLEN